MPGKRPVDLITGSAGIVGTHLAEHLCGMGRRVRTLDLKRWPLLPPGTEAIIGDVRDPGTVREAVEGVENVYHLATLIAHDRVPGDVFRSVIVDGGEHVVRLAHGAGARRIVAMTTTEVYGRLGSETRSEEGERNPLDEYGRAKKRLEDVLFNLAANGAPLTILRPPVIVGPRFQFPPVHRIFRILRRNLPAPLIGDGSCRIQFAHVNDVVTQAVAAASRDAAVGEAFNVASKEVPTYLELMQGLRRYIGSSSPLVPVPVGATLAVFRALNRFMSPFFLEPGQFEILGQDYLLDLSKAERLLGWTPQYTNMQAFFDAYDWHLCMNPYPKPRHLRPKAFAS